MFGAYTVNVPRLREWSLFQSQPQFMPMKETVRHHTDSWRSRDYSQQTKELRKGEAETRKESTNLAKCEHMWIGCKSTLTGCTIFAEDLLSVDAKRNLEVVVPLNRKH